MPKFGRSTNKAATTQRVLLAGMGALICLVLLPAVALAHLERPSYWPDPGPDNSVSPAAGGAVPDQKSLGSALKQGRKGLFVACKGKDGRQSMGLVRRFVERSQKKGFRVRASAELTFLSKKKGRRLIKLNKRFADRCRFNSIQDAIDKAGNNDRVVIMPGRYPEQESRRQPVNDPRCAGLTQVDTSGRETPSFAYQATCPHDQNLVYVQGRKIADTPPPQPPLDDRHGIPDLGDCLKCNLQVEGSGPRPVDVVIDAALPGKKRGAEAKPGEPKKDVVFRADRADGIVLTNLTLKGAEEHGFYTEETDGYMLNKVNVFWNLDYGNLSFTSDHGMFKNCDGMGAGDSVWYPGAGPETGEQADKSFYPDAPRVNTTIKKCDMRGSALGYSGSMGNAVRITESDIYGNGVGISSDTISASGHPGFPADSMEIDHSNIFSNNLNLYSGDRGLEPLVGVPVGTGILWPGMNNGNVHDNYIFDNWRYGAMLFAIPDVLVTPENEVEPGISCPTATPVAHPEDNTGQSTSCGNRYHDNHLGVTPPGWEPPVGYPGDLLSAKLRRADGDGGGEKMPNGTDWWWDEMAVNTGNCWQDNTGPDGSAGSVVASPPVGPLPGVNEPGTLPDECSTSIGNAANYSVKAAQLIECVTWERGKQDSDFLVCDWFRTPPKPDPDRSGPSGNLPSGTAPTSASAFKPTSDPELLLERLDATFGDVNVGAFENRP